MLVITSFLKSIKNADKSFFVSDTFQHFATVSKCVFGISVQTIDPRSKFLYCKVVDLAKIMVLYRTTFLSKTNSLASNYQKCRKNWTSAPKSITKGVPQPKLLVISKIFCVHFFTLDPTEKKLTQAFFHRNNILRVISRFRPLGPSKCKF